MNNNNNMVAELLGAMSYRINLEFNEVIENVDNSFPSIYSQTDVKVLLSTLCRIVNESLKNGTELINDLDLDKSEPQFDLEKIEQEANTISDDVFERIESSLDLGDWVNKEDCEFSIKRYNEIQLDYVAMNNGEMKEDITRHVYQSIVEFYSNK